MINLLRIFAGLILPAPLDDYVAARHGHSPRKTLRAKDQFTSNDIDIYFTPVNNKLDIDPPDRLFDPPDHLFDPPDRLQIPSHVAIPATCPEHQHLFQILLLRDSRVNTFDTSTDCIRQHGLSTLQVYESIGLYSTVRAFSHKKFFVNDTPNKN